MLRVFLIGLVLCFAYWGYTAPSHPPNLTDDSLKILSWNIYMLPPLIKFTGKKKRAEVIAQMLKVSDYDIVVFQEAFHQKARYILDTALQQHYPYRIGPANNHKKSWLKTHSGIWIISRLPLHELGEVEFSDCQGADCRARKGALMGAFEWNDLPMQVLGTHLESEGPMRINHQQCREITEQLLQPHQKTNVPQIICGDFNVAHRQEQDYQAILQILDADDGDLQGPQQFTFDGLRCDLRGDKAQGRIDYIFYRPNGLNNLNIRRRVVILQTQTPWRKRNKDLSDHFAVEITLSIK